MLVVTNTTDVAVGVPFNGVEQEGAEHWLREDVQYPVEDAFAVEGSDVPGLREAPADGVE